jgi:hypothetical protein
LEQTIAALLALSKDESRLGAFVQDEALQTLEHFIETTKDSKLRSGALRIVYHLVSSNVKDIYVKMANHLKTFVHPLLQYLASDEEDLVSLSLLIVSRILIITSQEGKGSPLNSSILPHYIPLLEKKPFQKNALDALVKFPWTKDELPFMVDKNFGIQPSSLFLLFLSSFSPNLSLFFFVRVGSSLFEDISE